MYSEYYGLTEKPFAIEPDSRFLVLVEHHREALSTMVYAIEEREGWALVIGDPGVGKTTLVMALLKELGESVVAGVVTNPRLEPLDFFNQVALELGLDGPFPSKGPFLASLSQLIFQCRRVGKQILLVVDEAQHLSGELLEELRLLGNLDNGSPRVLNIFLVGQPELIAAMRRGGAQALMQRLHRNYALKPLSPAETADYIFQRLTLAGGRDNPFTPEALVAVHQVTGGIPRLINSVCDGTLIMGFAKDKSRIGPELVWAVARDDASLSWQLGRGYEPPIPTPPPMPEPAPAAAQPEMMDRPSASVMPPPPYAPPPPPEPSPAPSAPEHIYEAAPAATPPALADLLDALEAPPAPDSVLAPPLTVEAPAAPESPKPPPGLAPPRRPQPAAASREIPKAEKKQARPAEPRAASGKSSKGGVGKRLIILLLVVGLAVGGYFLVKKYWYRIGPKMNMGGNAADVVIPEAPKAPGKDHRANQGPLDWGPLLPITPQSNQGQGENRG